MTRDVGGDFGYLKRVVEEGRKFEKGSQVVAEVVHEDWCGRPDGDECTCDPEIHYQRVG